MSVMSPVGSKKTTVEIFPRPAETVGEPGSDTLKFKPVKVSVSRRMLLPS